LWTLPFLRSPPTPPSLVPLLPWWTTPIRPLLWHLVSRLSPHAAAFTPADFGVYTAVTPEEIQEEEEEEGEEEEEKETAAVTPEELQDSVSLSPSEEEWRTIQVNFTAFPSV